MVTPRNTSSDITRSVPGEAGGVGLSSRICIDTKIFPPWKKCFFSPCNAGFQVGCIADFQIRELEKFDQRWSLVAADLEIGDPEGGKPAPRERARMRPGR